MSAVAFDIREPGAVARDVGEANQRLARESDVPSTILELIRDARKRD